MSVDGKLGTLEEDSLTGFCCGCWKGASSGRLIGPCLVLMALPWARGSSEIRGKLERRKEKLF